MLHRSRCNGATLLPWISAFYGHVFGGTLCLVFSTSAHRRDNGLAHGRVCDELCSGRDSVLRARVACHRASYARYRICSRHVAAGRDSSRGAQINVRGAWSFARAQHVLATCGGQGRLKGYFYYNIIWWPSVHGSASAAPSGRSAERRAYTSSHSKPPRVPRDEVVCTRF